MTVLSNRISNQELKAHMLVDDEPRMTISFYRYFNIHNPQSFRNTLYLKFRELKILGRVYIAAEGINAQISVPKNYFDALRHVLSDMHHQLDALLFNVALEDDGKSFWVLRMKVRPRIISDGIEDPTFNPENVGRYVKAEEVNVMADDPDVFFIDMRNHYEYEIGHFDKAIEIPSSTFRKQLPMVINMFRNKKNRTFLLYCTGGIRCEKASAWMLHNGFKNVYHVEGGIIEYTRRARENGLPVKFIGKNFVFDRRMSESVTSDIIAHCHQCNDFADSHVNCQNQKCHKLFIQCRLCNIHYDGCCSVDCKKHHTFYKKV